MATRKTLLALAFPLALAVSFLLAGAYGSVAHAQEPENTATSTATSTIESTESATTEPWYTVDRLNGTNGGDFVVGPGRIELEVEPGQTVETYITVANRVDNDRRFKIEVEDMAGSADPNEALVLLGDRRGPYSVKDYISTQEDELTLDLGEIATIPVQVSIPADAEPGGYYGSVLVQTLRTSARDPLNGGVGPRSPVIARVGTLFFITVPGAVETSGELRDLTIEPDKLWHESGPLTFGILFENMGSKHLNPYGEIRVRNIFGEEVGFTELEPWFVLPQSLRLREVEWDREHLLGRYTATINLNRGYDDVIDTMSVTFWVLPWKIIAGVFGVVFIGIFLIRLFFRTFEFKRKS